MMYEEYQILVHRLDCRSSLSYFSFVTALRLSHSRSNPVEQPRPSTLVLAVICALSTVHPFTPH